MRQVLDELEIGTCGQGFYEVTGELARWLYRQPIRRGLLTVFLKHTSASLVIQENVDADVQADMAEFFRRLVPEDAAGYRHAAEGPDDMPAHIRAALTQTQLALPVTDGRLALGTYQGVFLFEHRRSPKRRRLALHLLGE